MVGRRTSIENEGGTLQVKSEGDSVGTNGNTFSDTVMVVDFVTVVLQLCGGGEELAKVNTSVGTTVVDTGVNQSLGPSVRSAGTLSERSDSRGPDVLPRVSDVVTDPSIALPSG